MFQYADLSKIKSTPTVREQVSLNFFIDIRYPIIQRQRGANSGFCISSYHQLLCGVLFAMFFVHLHTLLTYVSSNPSINIIENIIKTI